MDRGYEILRTVEATALFVDVRGSSAIVDFVERHHGPQAAAALFMEFLAGCMRVVEGTAAGGSVGTAAAGGSVGTAAAGGSVDFCEPSGDAVLATFTGPDRVATAVEAAWHAVEYVQHDFRAAVGQYLTCAGGCGDRECPGTLPFRVGAGIDDGVVAVAWLPRGQGKDEQLVGSCVSLASKLSGRVEPPNSVGITGRAYQRGLAAGARLDGWHRHHVTLGGVRRVAMFADDACRRRPAGGCDGTE